MRASEKASRGPLPALAQKGDGFFVVNADGNRFNGLVLEVKADTVVIDLNIRPGLGFERDAERERVERGLAIAQEHLHFVHGGFETPLPDGLAERANVIRAFNVLRQYDESAVAEAWSRMQSRLTDDGLLIEGTCDEIGRLSTWITLDKREPLNLTISMRLSGLDLPSKVAERLPKALIHHNLPGERIHEFLQALDSAWRTNAGLGAFGAAQRWVASCEQLVSSSWPLIGDKKRWRLGELTIEWAAVAP